MRLLTMLSNLVQLIQEESSMRTLYFLVVALCSKILIRDLTNRFKLELMTDSSSINYLLVKHLNPSRLMWSRTWYRDMQFGLVVVYLVAQIISLRFVTVEKTTWKEDLLFADTTLSSQLDSELYLITIIY